MTPLPVFKCDICGTVYDTPAEAKTCESAPAIESTVKVGQRVVTIDSNRAGTVVNYAIQGLHTRFWHEAFIRVQFDDEQEGKLETLGFWQYRLLDEEKVA